MMFHRSLLKSLFLFTPFVSASILFSVQPLASRILLPIFGGSSAVWTTCMLFFQFSLLVGYFVADQIERKLSFSGQKLLFLVLVLLAGASFLKGLFPPDRLLVSSDRPVSGILFLLVRDLGLPFSVLSITSPLLQCWYKKSFPDESPYRLYAASNLGSFLALLSYPFFIEPLWGLRAQREMWMSGYCVFFLLLLSLVILTPQVSKFDSPEQSSTTEFSWSWLLYPFLSSTLLLGFTEHLTTDVAPFPFLWVAPLSIYLLSFILSFREPSWYSRKWSFLSLALVVFFFGGDFFSGPTIAAVVNVAFCLFAILISCLVCHGELFRTRPGGSDLARFYLCIALGGALGSLFCSIVAPLLFSRFLELPLALSVLYYLRIYSLFTRQEESVFPAFPQRGFFSDRLFLLALASFGVLWYHGHREPNNTIVYQARNFYGTMKVVDHLSTEDPSETYRTLIHGRIQHGSEYLDPVKERIPTAYYGEPSPLALLFHFLEPKTSKNIGVVGLGVGTSGAWARSGDKIVFYELNPLVVSLAKEYFRFLSTTPAEIEIVLGDARLQLESEVASRNFDLLLIDAFSSDAIPMHLLSMEAMKTYLRHLGPQGILAIHTSNRHLRLNPIALRLGKELKLFGGLLHSLPNPTKLDTESSYVVLSRDKAFFEERAARSRLQKLTSDVFLASLWTDDHSSLLRVMRWPPTIEAYLALTVPSDFPEDGVLELSEYPSQPSL